MFHPLTMNVGMKAAAEGSLQQWEDEAERPHKGWRDDEGLCCSAVMESLFEGCRP